MNWIGVMAVLAALGLAGWIVGKLNSPKSGAVSCIHCGECVRAGRCVLTQRGRTAEKEREKSADFS